MASAPALRVIICIPDAPSSTYPVGTCCVSGPVYGIKPRQRHSLCQRLTSHHSDQHHQFQHSSRQPFQQPVTTTSKMTSSAPAAVQTSVNRLPTPLPAHRLCLGKQPASSIPFPWSMCTTSLRQDSQQEELEGKLYIGA